ncbi:MAG: 4-hydroxy-2-oxovalerate aldolase, partial [Candidatus Binatia bacterium]
CDTNGASLPHDVEAATAAVVAALDVPVGIHCHNDAECGVANSLAAVEAGAARIDGSAAGLGAGAGNTPLEVFAAVSDRMGISTGVDLYKLMDVAEERVVPVMDQPIRVDRESLILGWAGVYSTFLLFAKRAEERYGVSARDILVELGRRGTVGGQEDMIESVAMELAKGRPMTPTSGRIRP